MLGYVYENKNFMLSLNKFSIPISKPKVLVNIETYVRVRAVGRWGGGKRPPAGGGGSHHDIRS